MVMVQELDHNCSSSHADIDMISFTGSTRAGRLITKNAAETIKKVCLELGGKGANIVFADASEKSIKRGVRRVFNNSGQSCNAPTRLLVEQSIYKKAIQEAIDVANETSVDLAEKKGRHIGPVVSKVQFDKNSTFHKKRNRRRVPLYLLVALIDLRD